MNKFTYKVLISSIACLFNLALFVGTAYLIVCYQWSKWWVVLALLLCATLRKSKCKKCGYDEVEDDK